MRDIQQELIKKGFDPVSAKYINRKGKYEKNLLAFALTNDYAKTGIQRRVFLNDNGS